MRHNSQPRESATISHRRHIENRYFQFGSVRLTYLTCMGRNAHHGVWWPGDANSLRTVHPAGTPWRWELPNASSVVTRLLPMLRPTHVVYFVGGVHLKMQQARHVACLCTACSTSDLLTSGCRACGVAGTRSQASLRGRTPRPSNRRGTARFQCVVSCGGTRGRLSSMHLAHGAE